VQLVVVQAFMLGLSLSPLAGVTPFAEETREVAGAHVVDAPMQVSRM